MGVHESPEKPDCLVAGGLPSGVGRPIRIVILTEDEPLFTAEALQTFFSEIGQEAATALVVVTNFSPAGTKRGWWSTLRYFWRVFGGSTFLRVGLEYLRGRIHPDKRVAVLLRRRGIPLLKTTQSVNGPEVIDAVRAAHPDLIVSAGINSLFEAPLLRIAPCFGLHLSLLPRHKGLMPVFWALHDDDRETGATVFRVNNDIDGGEILVQKRVAIHDRRLIQLYGELKRIGMIAIAEAVRRFEPGGANNLAPGRTRRPLGNRTPGPAELRRFYALGNRVF